nr:hypothetical protein Ade03nite_41350 [Actinoplanes derwentensis]
MEIRVLQERFGFEFELELLAAAWASQFVKPADEKLLYGALAGRGADPGRRAEPRRASAGSVVARATRNARSGYRDGPRAPG